MQNRYLALLTIAVVMILLIGVVIWHQNSKPKPPTAQTLPMHSVQYEGLDPLLDRGLTTQQLVAAEKDMTSYINSTHQNVNTVSLEPDSITKQTHDQNDLPELTFTLTFDQRPIRTVLEYDVDTIHLWLYSNKNVLLYDSKGH